VKKIPYLLTLAIFSAALADPALAELTGEEVTIVSVCKKNIEEATLSPKEAEKCVKTDFYPDAPLYKKLKAEDQDSLNYILKYNGVITELGEFFREKPRECHIRQRFVDILDNSRYQKGCILCDLQMAPQPEKMFPWIGKYYNDSLQGTQKASLTWANAGATRAAMLGNFSVNQARWEQMTISERTAVILADTYFSGRQTYPAEIANCWIVDEDDGPYMRHNIPADILAAIDAYKDRLMTGAGAAGGKAGGTGPDASRFAAANAKIKAATGKDGDTLTILGAMFDKKTLPSRPMDPSAKPKPAVSKTAAAAAAAKYELPADKLQLVAAEVKTRMLGGTSTLDNKPRKAAFSGTPWEDEALKFYTAKGKDGKPLHGMNFQVMPIGTDNGGYCPQHAVSGCGNGYTPGSIAVNKTLVEAWMKKNKVTAEQLTKDPKLMDRLGRHLYMVMVHEGPVHEVRQDQFYIAKGVDNKKILDKEGMAFGLSALSMKNKLNGPEGALYRREMSDFDKETLKALEKGGFRGMKEFVRYYDLEGVQGVGAKTVKQLEYGMKDLELRKTDTAHGAVARDPDNCSWYVVRNCTDAQLTAMTQKAYPWYETAITRQKSETAMMNEILEREINESRMKKSLKAKKIKQLRDFNAEGL
jgi:hypothetical protein